MIIEDSQHSPGFGGLFRIAAHYTAHCDIAKALNDVDRGALVELVTTDVLSQLRMMAEAELNRRDDTPNNKARRETTASG